MTNKVSSLQEKIVKFDAKFVKLNATMASKESLEKLDHKLENIVKVNDLKKNANGRGGGRGGGN